ncbi:hypothetical protein K438DRAFT_2024209 [Mycena galopus ATCC 62051]|nr:hypothetical protein K438DRAFT_2024209 [Mycena galopus ATCC 62051]
MDKDVQDHGTPMSERLPEPESAVKSGSQPATLDASRHQNSFILCITLLVVFLHTKHHVSFRACAIILTALQLLSLAIPGNVLGGETIPRSLTTVFNRLDLKDNFRVHPICYRCHRIFDPDCSSDTVCPNCETEIFRPQTENIFRQVFEGSAVELDPGQRNTAPKRSPHVVAPIQSLLNSLERLFTRPGMGSAVTTWKSRVKVPGELKTMQDADVWRTIKGPDGESFFFGGKCDEEIRLGVTFSLDW